MNKRELGESERKRKKQNELGMFVVLLVGALVCLIGVFGAMPYIGMTDTDHMTDQGIAVRDLDNATYTFEGEWLLDQAHKWNMLLWVGLVPFLVAYVMLLTLPGDKSIHRKYCTMPTEINNGVLKVKVNYCPECGIKISRLEKD